MMIDIVNYLVVWFREKSSRLSFRAKQALSATAAIVVLMLIVDFFALIIGPLIFSTGAVARFGIIWLIPLTALLIAAVALIWGSADIAQEIVPASAKNEVNTTKAIRIAATFGAVNVMFLLVPIIWEIESLKAFYILVLAGMATTMFLLPSPHAKLPLIAMAVLLVFFPLRTSYAETSSEGGVLDAGSRSLLHTIGRRVADIKDIGMSYAPNKPGKQVVRNKVRDWAYDRAKADAAGSKPASYDQLLDTVETAGTHAYMAQLAERKGFANAEGRRLSLTSTAIVSGTHTRWQRVRNDGNPVEIFPGDTICAEGEMANTALTDHSGNLIWVGPEGITLRKDQRPSGYSQRYARYPMFAFLGRVDGDDSSIFLIRGGCDTYHVAGRNFEIMGNVPYYNLNGLAAPNMSVRRGRGQFSLTRVGGWKIGS